MLHLLLLRNFRSGLAWLMLLCFGRLLVPEAAWLAAHRHEHTHDAPAAARGAAKGKLLLSPKHQHCHVEQLYDVPFQLAGPVAMPAARVRVAFRNLMPAAVQTCAARPVGVVALRGPPTLA